jgi:hypothetical protein
MFYLPLGRLHSREIFILPLRGYIWSTRCNMRSGYQLSICSRIKENHGNPWSGRRVEGPSGCKLTSNHQTGIKYENPKGSLYLCCRFIWKRSSYLTGNTLRLRYKAQPVNAVWGNSRCLLWEPYGTHKYTVWAECRVFFTLKQVVCIVTVVNYEVKVSWASRVIYS